MNCNFYWQPTCFQILPEVPTTYFFDQTTPSCINHKYSSQQCEQLKNKCLELELENLRLKQEVSLLQKKNSQGRKRIVKRRKQEELQKNYKCQHQNCKKQYASSLALNLHIKTKHAQENKDNNNSQKCDFSFDQIQIKQQGEYFKVSNEREVFIEIKPI